VKSVSLAGMLLTVGILAAGCSASTTSTGSSGTSTPTGSAAATSSSSASSGSTTGSASSGSQTEVTTCRASDLQATLGGGAGAGMSQDHTGLQLRNIGSSTCTLYGYPGVSWVAGANGSQVGAAASRAADNSGSAEKVITLAPGAAASAPLDIVDAAVIPKSECKPVPVRGLRVYPPGERAALFIPMSGDGSGQYGECSVPTAQSTLIIGYMQPGAQPTS